MPGACSRIAGAEGRRREELPADDYNSECSHIVL